MVRKNICCTVVGLALAASLTITRCNVSIKVGDKEFTNCRGSVVAQEDTRSAGLSVEEVQAAEDAGQVAGKRSGCLG